MLARLQRADLPNFQLREEIPVVSKIVALRSGEDRQPRMARELIPSFDAFTNLEMKSSKVSHYSSQIPSILHADVDNPSLDLSRPYKLRFLACWNHHL